jgi:hypothetical protein
LRGYGDRLKPERDMNEHPTNLFDLPVPDYEEAQSFLYQLDPDTEDFTFQTFTDSDEKKKTYTISPTSKKLIDPLAKVCHGSLQQNWQQSTELRFRALVLKRTYLRCAHMLSILIAPHWKILSD